MQVYKFIYNSLPPQLIKKRLPTFFVKMSFSTTTATSWDPLSSRLPPASSYALPLGKNACSKLLLSPRVMYGIWAGFVGKRPVAPSVVSAPSRRGF